ncbi:MAG TPA: hypothetical protein VGG23_00465 [Acidimicrobiales bacterium]
MSALRRAGVIVAVIVTATVLLAGCGGVIGSIVSTQDDIRSAGFGNAKVGLAGGDNDVTISAGTAGAPANAAFDQIAGIVWKQFHVRFDVLRITLHGDGRTVEESLSFATMQRDFGARSPADNKTTLRGGLLRFGIIAVVVVVVVLALAAVIVLLLVRRSRRRRRRSPPPGAWGPGQPGPGQGGYGPAPQGPGPRAPGHGGSGPSNEAWGQPRDAGAWGRPVDPPAASSEDPGPSSGWGPPPR